MPGVASLSDFCHEVDRFFPADLTVEFEPQALVEARRAVDESGVLLLGEVHGVRENPLLIRELMQVLDLHGLALEWPAELMMTIRTFLANGELIDHPLMWSGDGRITAGHLALLRERTAAGPLHLTLFDGAVDGAWTWSQRDEAMAGRVLAAQPADMRTLIVAGNAHTPTHSTDLGLPLGAVLTQHRPGVRDIHIAYRSGGFYNLAPRRFGPEIGPPHQRARLHLRRGGLVLDLPAATEAVVPHRPD